MDAGATGGDGLTLSNQLIGTLPYPGIAGP
jgi:hypothetical protein